MVKRKNNDKNIQSLKTQPLFLRKLQSDPDIFPAIRKSSISFYYKKGKLFEWKDGKFSTHQKYGVKFGSKDYIGEGSVASFRFSDNFLVDYNIIKSNCKAYQKSEGIGIGDFIKNNKYTTKKDIVVLDIEITLTESKSNIDRIDILLFDTIKKVLKFVEAKDFTNKELWASKGRKAKVFEQIDRYKTKIEKKKDDIVEAYISAINSYKKLFNLKLPNPESIDKQVVLFIFGFDRNQLQGRLEELIINNDAIKNQDYYYYACGDPSKANINSLFRGKPI